MLRISQLKLPVEHTEAQLKKKLLKTAHIKEQDLKQFFIRKRSVDGRKKPELYYVYTVDLIVANEEHVKKISKGKLQTVQEKNYHIPEHGAKKLRKRPVVIGSGPAGLFCAYLLAFEGYEPLVIERGAPVRERQKVVEQFWKDGILNTASNVQFGEGGAGTFSDGKLNTLVKDKFGRNRFVLETFVKLNGCHRIETDAAVFAVGHSARDTFQMLFDRNVAMKSKSFAIGVRAEHRQDMIDEAMYGRKERGPLGAAAYKLTAQLENGRGVYTFCMCPGGYVVNASSEQGRLAVNGMSYHDRAGENANSAVIVTVTKDDYGSDHPLAGMEFQRRLEKKAWEEGGGNVPIQRFADFCTGTISVKTGNVTPNIKGKYVFGNVRNIFPPELAESIESGIRAMGKKIKDFDHDDVILSGVESRTSSPVKIFRKEDFTSSFPWIYPCGEGAGYAGGITSAAMDGMKVAEAIIKTFSAPDSV